MRIVVVIMLALAIFAEEAIFVVVESARDESVIHKITETSTTEFFSFEGELADREKSKITCVRISPDGRFIVVSSEHDRYYNPTRQNLFKINSEGTAWRQITPEPSSDEYAYTGPTGTITGQVTYDGGYVSASIRCQGVVAGVDTDAFGNFTISGVPPGVRKVYAYTWGGVEMVWGWNLVEVIAGMTSTCNITNVGYSDLYGKDRYSEPIWSSDGRSIYFKSRHTGGIFRTSSPWSWSFDSVLAGDWLPNDFWGFDVRPSDGKIVYAISGEGLYTANSDGSGRTMAYSNRDVGHSIQGINTNPRWSPDGRHIAFLVMFYNPPEYSGNAVFVMNYASGEIESWFGWGGGFPRVYGWSPDGTYILVSHYESDYSEMYLHMINPFDLDDQAAIFGPANIWSADWGVMRPSEVSESIDRPELMNIYAYPNPFNSAVKISTDHLAASYMEASIYDVEGTLVHRFPKASSRGIANELIWTPHSSVRSGVYIVHARIGERTGTKRVVYIK